MSILDITEYAELGVSRSGGRVLAGIEPAITNQQLVIGAGSLQSAVLNETTTFVRLHADIPCRVLFGTNPTANGTHRRLSAGATEYLGVSPGLKIAVIQSA
jgi:hypothetical protein